MRHRLIIIAGLLTFAALASGATLNLISDTLSSSQLGIAANHTIRFTTITAIPASGKIIITPQAGSFEIPAGLDFTDIDLQVNDSQKSLTLSSVSVISGTGGQIAITLNDPESISGGSSIIIKIGTNAEFGEVGNQQMINPGSSGSYRVRVITKNLSASILDDAYAMIAITSSVSVSASGQSSSAPSPVVSPAGGGSGNAGGGYISELPVSLPAIIEPCKLLNQLLAQLKVLITQMEAQGLKVPEAAKKMEASLDESSKLTRALSPGMYGEDVKALQRFLSKDQVIYPEGLVTGYYGPATKRAIIRLQVKNNLEQVGRVGPKTLKLLNGLMNTFAC